MRKWALALVLTGAFPAHAEPSAAAKLEQTQKNLEQEKARAEQLSKQKNALANELKQSRAALISLAAEVQKSEAKLNDAEEKLTVLTRERKQRKVALEEHSAQIAAMLAAAIRLSQTPPEAALMMPGDVGDTLVAARILATLSDSIRAESKDIVAQMRQLEEFTAKVERTKAQMQDAQTALKSQRAEMEAQFTQRRALDAQLTQEQDKARKRVVELSHQAKDLEGLLKKLETQRPTPPPSRQKLRAFATAKGALRLPAAGKVVQRFGQSLGKNETSKGILLRAGSHGAVVAPFDGEVVFTGPFLHYGNMVILRHSGDYHTLLAGFDVIRVSPGQFLLEGEPIGAMGETSTGAELYVELREHNQPIDPAPWIKGLN